MNYIEKLELAIKEIKEFDEVVEVKISELVEVINNIDFNGLLGDTTDKKVLAHKNRKLKVINRVIDKFAREVKQYILEDKE